MVKLKNPMGEKSIMEITKSQFKEIFEKSVYAEIKSPQMIFQKRAYKHIRNYLRDYAEKVGMYFVEVDEFTDTYIDEIVDLYKKMSDNDYCIIYVRMYDVVDYTTSEQKTALCNLIKRLDRHDNNLQFIIDYHITSSDEYVEDIPITLMNRCFVWEIK